MLYQNILLIDDDPEDHEILTTALETISNKLRCTSYTDAREVLHKLNHKELSPDLIFLDLNMPVMSGQEFLQELKGSEQLQTIPVIIFSTSSNHTAMAATKLLGAMDFITKPNKFDDLIAVLKPIFNSPVENG